MEPPLTVTAANSANAEEPITLELTDRLSLRTYRDCRPSYLETGALQKGIVLLLDGEELIEEGVGFGVPVAKYDDKTYFSSSAKLFVQEAEASTVITKEYSLDTISRKRIGRAGYIDDRLYSPLRKLFERNYLKSRKLTPLFNKLMELREVAKIKTDFVKVTPRGTVTVTYRIQPASINITVDFTNLSMNKCIELLVLNEQGSNFFQKYADLSGLFLQGRRIGAWKKVTAETAWLMGTKEQIFFCLQNIKGATLFRGWERTKNRFSWAGLSYSLRPNRKSFDYTIKLKVG